MAKSTAKQAKGPKVSIVIPTYMEEKYLAATLESITSQKPGFDFEIVVSDAHSTDATAKIAKSYGANGSNQRTCANYIHLDQPAY